MRVVPGCEKSFRVVHLGNDLPGPESRKWASVQQPNQTRSWDWGSVVGVRHEGIMVDLGYCFDERFYGFSVKGEYSYFGVRKLTDNSRRDIADGSIYWSIDK